MLSATAEHAVRALMQLALLGRECAVTGRQLSSQAGIPPNYLSKILALLNHAGLITATRGSRGGYQLLKRPEQISLTEVVNLFDSPRWRRRCFLDCGHDCEESANCAAHLAWRDCREVFERFLDSTTIASLAGPANLPPLSLPLAKRRRTS
jgi:Rrf2 family iron-sulfur cluster assembly transcriptional regulator